MSTPRHLVVVGAGGNIGSHLVPHLARMDEVRHVTLVDPESYETTNLVGQDIRRQDVGAKKVSIQARRLRAIRPELQVTAIPEPVENVPLGLLRADLVLACLDSRRARQRLNQAAIFLGAPWIDSGVRGDQLLAGIAVYDPAKSGPCLECGWGADDYAALEVEYPCSPRNAEPAPTRSPSSLGALAASLQAIECGTRLADDPTSLPAGTRVLVDARHHKQLVTTYRRNPACRITSHSPRPIERTEAATTELTLGEAFGMARYRFDTVRLSVEGKSFARSLACIRCAARRRVLRLASSLTDVRRRCQRCGAEMSATGFDAVDSIGLSEMTSRALDRKLASLGFRSGEVFSISDGRRERHFELGQTRKR